MENLYFEGTCVCVYNFFCAFFSFCTSENFWTLAESEERYNQDSKEEIEEAISWYNKVLGFHIEGGHGNWSHLIVQHLSCKYHEE